MVKAATMLRSDVGVVISDMATGYCIALSEIINRIRFQSNFNLIKNQLRTLVRLLTSFGVLSQCQFISKALAALVKDFFDRALSKETGADSLRWFSFIGENRHRDVVCSGSGQGYRFQSLPSGNTITVVTISTVSFWKNQDLMNKPIHKIMLLGSMSVGKTSIAKRLKFNTFDLNHKSTIDIQLYSFDLEHEGRVRELVLWDTDGEYEGKVMQSIYVKGSDAAIVVGDASRQDTIETMLELSEKFKQQEPGAPVLSLINKSDLKIHSETDIDRYRQRVGDIRHCSAKYSTGIFECIKHLVHRIDTAN